MLRIQQNKYCKDLNQQQESYCLRESSKNSQIEMLPPIIVFYTTDIRLKLLQNQNFLQTFLLYLLNRYRYQLCKGFNHTSFLAQNYLCGQDKFYKQFFQINISILCAFPIYTFDMAIINICTWISEQQCSINPYYKHYQNFEEQNQTMIINLISTYNISVIDDSSSQYLKSSHCIFFKQSNLG
ncbi:unnamed protein product (macronuclear) [Paramecium tetraurelia]|uniref:Transmembrane protein n=1 Tax=Paramecium tetraurelia TaxID=5888 RepID=A0CUV9_PARTE|nr:uncharacterized protein GSPATT00039031001 [Paramecium tetraurelia]CAK74576.1 unnamed protein product [Paramecium tetraurelia]|eukprot:XP_001441973.1 hypothetical protein (macronuclear) [Paramecium tetraurelia strain d4-2]